MKHIYIQRSFYKAFSFNSFINLCITLIVLGWYQTALAACSNPEGDEADITYNQTYNVPMVCDGSNWQALGPSNASAGTSGCSVPDGAEGDMTYNTTHDVMQYCDGDDWIEISGQFTETPGCFLPASVCPTASSSSDGCISGGTISWGAVSCSTSGDKFKMTFSDPKIEIDDGAYPPGGSDSGSVRTSAQAWCAELGFSSENLAYNSSGSYNYWAPQNDDTGWIFRNVTIDNYATSIDCFINVNAR